MSDNNKETIEHDYKVTRWFPNGYSQSQQSRDPKYIGDRYREIKKDLMPGESVELNKRTVTTSPWEFVEKESK